MQLRLDADAQAEQMTTAADADGVSRNEWVLRLVRAALDGGGDAPQVVQANGRPVLVVPVPDSRLTMPTTTVAPGRATAPKAPERRNGGKPRRIPAESPDCPHPASARLANRCRLCDQTVKA